jgi:alkylation response protein AidB-like acyl-CoA dehydrogenase
MSEMLDLGELREAVRGVLVDRRGDAMEIPGEEGRGLDRALWDEMAALGWLGLSVAEAHGGLGQTVAHLGILYEELGRELASVPLLPTMLAAAAIEAHGDAEVQARWLPSIAAGACLAAASLPGEGGVATLAADGCVSGPIDHAAFGDVADLLLVPVRRAGETALALIAADQPGVTVTRRAVVDLTRSVARIELDGVSPEALLPIDEAGWNALADHAAMALASDAVGACAALLKLTVDYLQIREQFGRPIGSFQALKHRAADWKVKIEATTALTRHAAALIAAGGEGASATASEAKAYACDTFAVFAGDAVQLHGGIGFTWEHPCHLFLKRAKLGQQLHGSSTVHKERAARFAFGRDESIAAPASKPRLQAV